MTDIMVNTSTDKKKAGKPKRQPRPGLINLGSNPLDMDWYLSPERKRYELLPLKPVQSKKKSGKGILIRTAYERIELPWIEPPPYLMGWDDGAARPIPATDEWLDEVVIDPAIGMVGIRFTYPLHNPSVLELAKNHPRTRRHLIDAIRERYRIIYDEEAAVAGPPVTYGEARAKGPTWNAIPRKGPHGIWGHKLNHLSLEGMYPARRLGTDVYYELEVSS